MRKRTLTSAAAATLLMAQATLASSPPAPPATPLPTSARPEAPGEASPAVYSPEWLRKPSGEDIGRVYPREAAKKNTAGRARIRCEVAAAGQLNACTIASEDPQGAGFGAAALKLAPKFQMTPKLRDGRSTEGGSVIIPIIFLNYDLPPLLKLREVKVSEVGVPSGRATVRCRVSGTSPMPIFEDCVALTATPEELSPSAVKAAEEMVLPSGTPGGLNVLIPFVFEGTGIPATVH